MVEAEPLEDYVAYKHSGSNEKAGQQLGVNRQTVWRGVRRGDAFVINGTLYIPSKQARTKTK